MDSEHIEEILVNPGITNEKGVFVIYRFRKTLMIFTEGLKSRECVSIPFQVFKIRKKNLKTIRQVAKTTRNSQAKTGEENSEAY